MRVGIKDISQQEDRDLKEDLKFIKLLTDYIKKTPNKAWSKQQADFINSVLKGANQNKELYLKVKEIAKKS